MASLTSAFILNDIEKNSTSDSKRPGAFAQALASTFIGTKAPLTMADTSEAGKSPVLYPVDGNS